MGELVCKILLMGNFGVIGLHWIILDEYLRWFAYKTFLDITWESIVRPMEFYPFCVLTDATERT